VKALCGEKLLPGQVGWCLTNGHESRVPDMNEPSRSIQGRVWLRIIKDGC
jgi:hypothetical protein